MEGNEALPPHFYVAEAKETKNPSIYCFKHMTRFFLFCLLSQVRPTHYKMSYCHLVAASDTSLGISSMYTLDTGVSYLPVVSFTSWMIRGLRVTIPAPRGRKSLLQRKKWFGEGYTHRDAQLPLHCQANSHLCQWHIHATDKTLH